jgi:hypothetical protein
VKSAQSTIMIKDVPNNLEVHLLAKQYIFANTDSL